ncbi:hypothetical protein C1H76_5564 [Elsinoe australis]|uniref:GDP-mannose transporter n=1 Tax=Elsinoe australis TaxID=40998 RepID=A0A4U7B2I8_9PEZI|nr:hypothetical protein C1H76_5564 [Elsinoe australis]
MAERRSSDTEIFHDPDLEVGPLLEKHRDSDDSIHPEPTTSTAQSPPQQSSMKLVFWIAINILSTIGIVFTNKHLLTSPLLRGCQLLFASYHFLLTHLTLHLCSSRTFLRTPLFPRATTTPLTTLLPLATAMSLNVLLPNLSLAHSSIAFYQTTRVLLTPVTAVLNYLLYSKTISSRAALALVPVCLGVGCVTYFDVRPAPVPSSSNILPHLRPSHPGPGPGNEGKGTTPLGATFALTGVLASSIYTLFIARYQATLQLSSVQLLHRQSLVGGVLLLYFVPWLDRLPVWHDVQGWQWGLIALSGACAVLINLSQFVIVGGAGPVASTVVGHAKTVGVVGWGWGVSGRGWREGGLGGVMLALAGMVGYTVVEMRERRRGRGG